MWIGAVMANLSNGAFAVLRINAQICVGTLKSHLGICFLVFQSLRCDTCPFFLITSSCCFVGSVECTQLLMTVKLKLTL